jgi:lysophospholipase L1-like esterase
VPRVPWRPAAAVTVKLLLALLLTALGLELGTRLLMPEERFELIPNTFDPVCRIRQIPHGRGFVRCPEYAMEFRINGQGLRQDREVDAAPAPGRLRVMCLGDSFTCGMGVGADQTFAARTGRLLGPGVEMLNAGVCGTGTAEQVAWLAADGRRLAPDVVVLAFCVNDWSDNTAGGLFTLAGPDSLRQHPAAEGRSLRWLRRLRALPGYDTWFARSHFLNRFRQWYAVRLHGRLAHEAASDRDGLAVWQAEFELTAALLRRLRRDCERDGIALVVMPIPAIPGSGEPERRQDALARLLADEDFVWLDLRQDMAGAMDAGLYYPVDGHWTAAGHDLAAERLAGRLAPLIAP